MTIAEAFGHAPEPTHEDGSVCEQGDDVTSGESWPYCAHGQRFSTDSERMLADLEDEGFTQEHEED